MLLKECSCYIELSEVQPCCEECRIHKANGGCPLAIKSVRFMSMGVDPVTIKEFMISVDCPGGSHSNTAELHVCLLPTKATTIDFNEFA